ncbi:MAG TPA: Nre family DNA repair protein [Candidatus Methanoperedens sp.]|nr:Nre family DNA repair protein [Candidatus Methanoperedens sp.]HLB69724.1 Nre family DNA repair protein [Candidatus Methanoperedens sp.]
MQSPDSLFQGNSDGLCILCRGSKLLCGKERCPVLVKFYSNVKVRSLTESLNIDGSSPPGVFVGRIGYPYVSVGPLIPPSHGDTRLLDTPEMWIGKSIDEIVDFRSQLVRGKHTVHIKQLDGSRIIEATREMALCSSPVDVEAEFLKKPSARLVLDDEVQPFGPTAPLKKIDVGSVKFNQRIEKAYYDTDLRAKDAVLGLYKDGILVSGIQKAFSVGAFGEGKARCFVPTRWSITAIDSMISENLMKKMKDFPLINEYLVFESWQLDNRFVVLMMPRSWSYELIEAWYPNTVWNPFGKDVAIMSSSEGYDGRSAYAEIGGCYYAARLAVNEYLVKEKRQARVVILREAHPGYIMPVGVWNVRENVRAALKSIPGRFHSLNDAFEYISTRLVIPEQRWIKESTVLKDTLFQKGLEDFLSA